MDSPNIFDTDFDSKSVSMDRYLCRCHQWITNVTHGSPFSLVASIGDYDLQIAIQSANQMAPMVSNRDVIGENSPLLA
jgi:hypothetical protein